MTDRESFKKYSRRLQLRQMVQAYMMHDKKRREALLSGDRVEQRVEHAFAVREARRAFDAGFSLYEFFTEVERQEDEEDAK